jgi:hypothetical protein
MKSTDISVGDIIDARCTKCRHVTNHVVVAMVESKPATVQCNTCQGIHRYRAPVSPPKTRQQPKAQPAIRTEERDTFQAAIQNVPARDYDMDKEYRAGTVIRHQSFGLGVVQRLAGNRKMEVLFETGKKTLRCK